ncbi:CobW family GTP-binding protein [Vibrio algarum]|uniref:GTP-binding protein n=1 Tax=Vibrio algarum TaxID=3020714 RepID=A0ABT4YWY9_9VIBR|nr:GTP-binding protein [Vibrio sp. KJ40-1]MDB1126102.1 GTP-binding protein [Vibrio sp. KJ40-1]
MSKRVPTNIITGFLGTGKTTAILNLLKRKPSNESWAVLVNEFGEIGIDGAILSDSGALIKEVPGGCMCCTAGVPMSVGINALLRMRPDRLLIEPTGLGHPKQVVATLTSAQYQNYVDLKATIALVDPRYFSDDRYTTNQNFNDQLASADIVVGNKVDQISEDDIAAFNHWLAQQVPRKIADTLTHHGEFELSLLDLERNGATASAQIEAHHHEHASLEPQFEIPPGAQYIRKENTGQGYHSCGWLFGAEITFNFDGMFSMLTALTAERVKGVVNTDKGCFAYNVSNGVVSVNELTLSGFESRIEVIDSALLPWDELEKVLFGLSDIDD